MEGITKWVSVAYSHIITTNIFSQKVAILVVAVMHFFNLIECQNIIVDCLM